MVSVAFLWKDLAKNPRVPERSFSIHRRLRLRQTKEWSGPPEPGLVGIYVLKLASLTGVGGGHELRQPNHHRLVHSMTLLQHERAEHVHREHGKCRQLDQRGSGEKVPGPGSVTLVSQHLAGNAKRASERQQEQ